MRDPQLRKPFGRAGRKRSIEKFSWRSVAINTKELREDLLEKNETTK